MTHMLSRQSARTTRALDVLTLEVGCEKYQHKRRKNAAQGVTVVAPVIGKFSVLTSTLLNVIILKVRSPMFGSNFDAVHVEGCRS